MTVKNPTNISASVRQRLYNRSEKDKRPFTELLQYYAMERFLYRLSVSPHANRFVLKGALMLKIWETPLHRPTMDIDMLGITSNKEEEIIAQIREILSVSVISDGIIFEQSTIKTTKILEDADYEGIKVMFQGKLDTAKINIQIDIGFGDKVFPKPEKANLPTLLDFPAPNLLCYSKESAIAEKFDAMVARGMQNSRMKDFYDVWMLSRQFNFEGHKLAEAIRLTFEQRRTEMPSKIEAFSEEFINSKPAQWSAFRNRLQLAYIPESFSEVVAAVSSFLTPISESIFFSTPLPEKWSAPGPWT